MALLTAQQVSDKAFQTVRFKEGYDVEEVDDFLDQVAQTLTAQQQRIAYLEGQLGAGSSFGVANPGMPAGNQGFVPDSSSSSSYSSSEDMGDAAGDDRFSSSQQVSWEQ
ncbi:DivIVA domain-containing protein [Bifidobacterium sp. ESL0728]|uniref:DivIVA domain-containing protein n=1 Tax=Bifidobacterium sp. ESL0728 TaxID=2983220 RepID=UPI0023F82445|nr:DivIVA domain-containing protein [Bifidobacterium sp. ESL0728]WEV58557.1 DivIVA domain-containing protein [Bifidobacterium sp. ESL0728]